MTELALISGSLYFSTPMISVGYFNNHVDDPFETLAHTPCRQLSCLTLYHRHKPSQYHPIHCIKIITIWLPMSQPQVSPLQNSFELTETLNPCNFPVYKSHQNFTSLLRLDSTTSMGPIIIITTLPTELFLLLLYSFGKTSNLVKSIIHGFCGGVGKKLQTQSYSKWFYINIWPQISSRSQ